MLELHQQIWMLDLLFIQSSRWAPVRIFFNFYLELKKKKFGPVNSHFHFEDCSFLLTIFISVIFHTPLLVENVFLDSVFLNLHWLSRATSLKCERPNFSHVNMTPKDIIYHVMFKIWIYMWLTRGKWTRASPEPVTHIWTGYLHTVQVQANLYFLRKSLLFIFP